jgi:hypothetical protein
MPALRTSSLRSLEERRLSRHRKSGSGLKWEPKDENQDQQPKLKPEPLPDDRRKLDALMNYHLGELDRLKKFVIRLNDDKEQHEVRLASAKHRAGGELHSLYSLSLSLSFSSSSFFLFPSLIHIRDIGMMASVVFAAELVRDVTRMRDGYLRYVSFHRDELDRIGRQVVELKRRSGETATPPEVVVNMLNRWYEWEILFSA